MNKEIYIILTIYFIIILLISFLSYKKIKEKNYIKEYFIGNRSIKGFIFSMVLTTTYISGSTFIGGPGAAYKYGLSWIFISLIQIPVILISTGTLGKKIAQLGKKYNAITINDILYIIFKNKKIIWIGSISLIIAFFNSMLVQFISAARLIESTINIPYKTALIIFSSIIIIHTIIGGFKGSVILDILHGLIILIGTLILLISTIKKTGGLQGSIENLKIINNQLISIWRSEEIFNIQSLISLWILICFGSIGLPHLTIRCLSFKNNKSMKNGIIIGTIIITFLTFSIHLSGALGRVLFPNISIPDQIIPKLIKSVLTPINYGIFLSSALSAIISTINAQLLQFSATLIKDIYLNINKNKKNKKIKIKIFSKTSILITGIILIFFSLKPPKMIIWLNLLSFGLLESVFFWPLILGFFWKKSNYFGAIISMWFSLIMYIILVTFEIKILNFHPVIPVLFFSFIIFITGNYLFNLYSKKKYHNF